MQSKIIKKSLAISERRKGHMEKWESALSDLKFFETKVAKARTPASKQTAQAHYNLMKKHVDDLRGKYE